MSTLKKKSFKDNERSVYGEAVISLRNGWWHFRKWIAEEGKDLRISLKTQNEDIAFTKAAQLLVTLKANREQGKKYFSLTAKEGVKRFVEQKQIELDSGLIVKGRLVTIKTHLKHWLDYVSRDKRLYDMGRNDCYNYFNKRTKVIKKQTIQVSGTTIANEQSTINAMIGYLFKNGLIKFDSFDFVKMDKVDRGIDAIRRATFTDEEMGRILLAIEDYRKEKNDKEDEEKALIRAVCCYYFEFAAASGLRTGEQRQLRWQDIRMFKEDEGNDDSYLLTEIHVRKETSKVKQSRTFRCAADDLLGDLEKLIYAKQVQRSKKKFADCIIFSVNGINAITKRSISYHFGKILEKAEIKDIVKRDLVPYSFRHYFITSMIRSNEISVAEVAKMCGTSLHQIDKTYLHIDDVTMTKNALAIKRASSKMQLDMEAAREKASAMIAKNKAKQKQ